MASGSTAPGARRCTHGASRAPGAFGSSTPSQTRAPQFSPGDRTWPGRLRLERPAADPGTFERLSRPPSARVRLSQFRLVLALRGPREGLGVPQAGGSALSPASGVRLTGSSWGSGRGGRPCTAALAPGPPLPPSQADPPLRACCSSPATHRDFQTLLSVQEAQLAPQTGLGETRASGQPEAPANTRWLPVGRARSARRPSSGRGVGVGVLTATAAQARSQIPESPGEQRVPLIFRG